VSALDFDIRLASVEKHLQRTHGSERVLSAGEQMVLIGGAQDILMQLRSGWPVVTGRSISGWDVSPVYRPFIGYTVTNGVDYAEYVHRAGEGPDPLWTQQVLTIRDQILPAIIVRLKQAITETERYSQPRDEQPSLFLARPQQQGLGNIMSQVRRLRSLVRAR